MGRDLTVAPIQSLPLPDTARTDFPDIGVIDRVSPPQAGRAKPVRN